VFFTSEHMTPEVYGLIYGWIADKLEESGYSVDRKERTRSEEYHGHPICGRPVWIRPKATQSASSICRARRNIRKTAF
jgi:hypothetical protein